MVDHPINEMVRQRIRAQLHRAERSAGWVSAKAGLSRDCVRDILVGRSASPSISTLAAIADALRVPVTDLISEAA